MAQPNALCDFEIQLTQVDLDRQASLRLKTARHPSETHERVLSKSGGDLVLAHHPLEGSHVS